MASDHWTVDSGHEAILPDAVCSHCRYSLTVGRRLTDCQTHYPVVSPSISISPHLNGGRVELIVRLVMNNNRLEFGGPSTSSAISPIVIDGPLQGEFGGDAQLQRQSELQLLATDFPNRNQYTPPYTPSGSHAESTTFPLGDAGHVDTEVEIPLPQAQAPKGNVHDTSARFPQNIMGNAGGASSVERAIETQSTDWDADHRHIDTIRSVHGSRSRTHSPAHSLTRGDSPVREGRSPHDSSRHSQRREVEYALNRPSSHHQSYSPGRCALRSVSPDTVHRVASKRGRSLSPKSLVDDHEQVGNRLHHDVSNTMTDRVRSQSSSSISGISGRESVSPSRSRGAITTQVHTRRGYTPPRMNKQPRSQWTRRASPINGTSSSYHEENNTLIVTRSEARGSLASRLDCTWTQKKASTPTTPQSGAEAPVTVPSPTYRFGKTRLGDYGMDGRQTRRRLQDRIDGNQTGIFNSKLGPRCPYSHRVNGAHDCHDKNQPHPGYTNDEWRDIMEFVQRVGYAPPHLTKDNCVYHPAFKPPESYKTESYKTEGYRPPESSQLRSHPLNPFNIPPAAQGTDRYVPPPTPPVPPQPSMAVPYPQAAPMPVPMPTPPFSSGPPSHTYPLRPSHIGASRMNPFENSGPFGARPLKKRKIGPQGEFRPASGDYNSQQQAQSDQWPLHSMPPPSWSQQPPNNQPHAPMVRPSYTRQVHRPNAFHNQPGPPPIPPPLRRKRAYDQH